MHFIADSYIYIYWHVFARLHVSPEFKYLKFTMYCFSIHASIDPTGDCPILKFEI